MAGAHQGHQMTIDQHELDAAFWSLNRPCSDQHQISSHNITTP